MKKIHILSTAISCLVIFGCNKTNNETTKDVSGIPDIPSIIAGYQAVNTAKVHGKFYVKSLTINDQKNTNTAQIGGAFYDDKGNIVEGGKVNIGGVELKPNKGFYGFDSFLERDKFFGHEVNFTVNKLITAQDPCGGDGQPPCSTGGGGGGIPVYVPQAITGNVNVIDGSYRFTWNRDPQNGNGVVIVAEYSPGLYANTGNPTQVPVRKSILVPDNGYYYMEANWFDSFPRNGTIVLYIGRGSYTLINQGDILVGTYAANAVFSFVMPAQ